MPMNRGARMLVRSALLAALTVAAATAWAQPTLTDPGLRVSTVVSGVLQPTGMAFIGANDFFVIEKASGRVQRVVNGGVTGAVLDLAVNSYSERGLLGIALDPDFPTVPNVYLFWTESLTGADSGGVSDVPLLGHRVDRFVWNGSTLTFGANLIRLRALQTDQNTVPPSTTVTPVGNHNGGKLAVGPDGKLYVAVGDVGRRSWMQNVTVGLLPPSFNSDDTFGGPESDNAHLTGVVLRLNLNGTAPTDNPFYAAGAALGGQVGANFQKIFSYGHRNGFGLAFDPASGRLWTSENGDDSFDEVNAVVAGGNYGWVQAMGPLGRIDQFKTIEANLSTAPTSAGALQQVRFPLSMVANTPAAALAALQVLPGSSYQDPEFSWRYAIAPSGLGFVRGPLLGTRFAGTLWSGMGRTTDLTGGASGTYAGGALMAFRLTGDRQHLDLTADARLADRVADNGSMYPPPAGTSPATAGFKFDGRESESLLVGQGFGAVTDIQAGPDQALYVVSSTNNAVYRIVRAPAPPTVVPQVAGTQGPSGVYSSAVTVSWSVSDDFGVTSSTGCGTTTLVDDTPGTTLTCSATNAIGLTAAAAVTIAIAQHFTDFPATPGTLGAIPDAPGAGQAGAPRDVTFTVTNLPRVGRVAVSMTFNPAHTASGDLTATLIAPDGTAHAIFARPGATNDLAGPYRFRDSAVLDFRTAATSGSPVASGTYRTSTAAGLTVMDGVLGGRAGNGVWTLRFVDHAPGNVGAVAAATLSLSPALPSNLRVNSVIGNLVQLRWDPPVGVAPPQYIVEGGVTPGVALAAFATGSSAPIFTFAAPSGVFWVRVRAGEVGGQSLPTAAVPLIVGVPVAPSAPEHFTATVAGSALNVAWRNTFGGGAPDTVVVDVTGSAAGTLPLGTSGAVNVGVVPGGSYTLSLRAANGGGVSPSSNAVSITVPTACSGAPNPPVNFLFYRSGGAVSMLWDPPATGSAPLGYTIEVTGSVNAALPFAGRVLTVPAPPGTYTVRVRADNACGASAFTAAQTVVVP